MLFCKDTKQSRVLFCLSYTSEKCMFDHTL